MSSALTVLRQRPVRRYLGSTALAATGINLLITAATAGPLQGADKGDNSAGNVSYYHQIRPLFQAHCQGCHQPAKDKG
ncbi:MAG: hypothetical protein VW708_04060, partial [Ilumatobacter sp.]